MLYANVKDRASTILPPALIICSLHFACTGDRIDRNPQFGSSGEVVSRPAELASDAGEEGQQAEQTARSLVTVPHPIMGYIDGVSTGPDGTDVLVGWACNKNYYGSIPVHVYVGGPAGVGTLVTSGMANLSSENAVRDACQSNWYAHRFSIPIAFLEERYTGLGIWVHGISQFSDRTNSAISNSGSFRVPSHSIAGIIDGINTGPDGTDVVSGWACSQGDPRSIDVHMYLGGPAGSGTLVTGIKANLSSEKAVADACRSNGTAYRFSIPLAPFEGQHSGKSIWIHGISLFPDSPNGLIGRSGTFVVPSHKIAGVIDGVFTGADGRDVVSGWACSQGDPRSVTVHLYLGGPAGSGTCVAGVTANLSSEKAVADACRSNGTAYRFSIPLAPFEEQYSGKSIWIHGISLFPDSPNDLIGRSGTFVVPSHKVTGIIDGVYTGADGTSVVSGWACNQGDPRSIDVHMYLGGPAGSGTIVTGARANFSSEKAVADACRSNGTAYRFSIPLAPFQQQHAGKSIWIHGISLFSDVANDTIGNSGRFTVPGPRSTIPSTCNSKANAEERVHGKLPNGDGLDIRTSLCRPGMTELAIGYNPGTDRHVRRLRAGHLFDATNQFNPAYATVGLSDTGGKQEFGYSLGFRQLPEGTIFCGYDGNTNRIVGPSPCTDHGDEYENVIVGFDMEFDPDHHLGTIFAWDVVDGSMRFDMQDFGDKINFANVHDTAWALVPRRNVRATYFCDGRGSGSLGCQTKAIHPVLSNFSLRYSDGDHHLGQLAVLVLGNWVDVALNDKDFDDDYEWMVRVVDLQ